VAILLIDDGLVSLPPDHGTDIETYAMPATEIASKSLATIAPQTP
jgi:hypothetical protein